MIDTINDAKASIIIYSIAETAKANNLKLYNYFKYLLTEISKYQEDTVWISWTNYFHGQQRYQRNVANQ